MTRDAIIDELRAHRDDIARECGYNVGALFDMFRRLEREEARLVGHLPPRRLARYVNAADAAEPQR